MLEERGIEGLEGVWFLKGMRGKVSGSDLMRLREVEVGVGVGDELRSRLKVRGVDLGVGRLLDCRVVRRLLGFSLCLNLARWLLKAWGLDSGVCDILRGAFGS